MGKFSRIKILLLIILVGSLKGCSREKEESTFEFMEGKWELLHISGGFAGIDEDFEPGSIVWNFHTDSGTLIIENMSNSDALYKGLPTGDYSYSVIIAKKNLFLEVNSQEFGGLTLTNNQMVLNQNIITNGSGADGFILRLKR
ncbi:hypothetical protein KCTC52924_01157 [Arenibacter antarcticus]|uniref:Lipocalin-like domain-containing protein n=1 Tax=Arenibacter antarcticus TaxID=2040469 RepID=A0ABW5VAK8_9FLAO|nr:hypothetical protein [Arenibacter sp. H213]